MSRYGKKHHSAIIPTYSVVKIKSRFEEDEPVRRKSGRGPNSGSESGNLGSVIEPEERSDMEYNHIHGTLDSAPNGKSLITDASAALGKANPIVAGVDAGAKAVESIAKVIDSASMAAERAGKLELERARENGKLQLEIAQNARKRAKEFDEEYNQKRHERWWKWGSYSPSHLDLANYNITKDEYWAGEHGKKPTAEHLRANADLQEDIRNRLGINKFYRTPKEEQELQLKQQEIEQAKAANAKAMKEVKAAEVKIRKVLAEAKREGLDINTDKLNVSDEVKAMIDEQLYGGGVPKIGSGSKKGGRRPQAVNMKDQSTISKYYPDPNMLNGRFW